MVAVALSAPVRRPAPHAGPVSRGATRSGRVFEVRSSRTPPLVSTDPHTFLLRLTTRCHFSDSRCVDPFREPPPSSRRQEAFGIERHLLTPQVIHAPPQLRLQDRQRLLLATLPLLTGQPCLGRRHRAQHQTCRLAESPLQVRIADLATPVALDLARTLVLA